MPMRKCSRDIFSDNLFLFVLASGQSGFSRRIKLPIRDNLLIGNPEATEEDMRKACEQTYFDDFIHTLP